jgi:hypothetical protein
MTDTSIVKSNAYIISGGVMKIAVDGSDRLNISKSGEQVMEFDLILIPTYVTMDKISSLADVESFGGRVLATASALSNYIVEP